MTIEDRKALVETAGRVTVNGFPAMLTGYAHEDGARITVTESAIKQGYNGPDTIVVPWDDARIIVNNGGKFST